MFAIPQTALSTSGFTDYVIFRIHNIQR